jgi:hypothetical protein
MRDLDAGMQAVRRTTHSLRRRRTHTTRVAGDACRINA